jgi:spermidine synthase
MNKKQLALLEFASPWPFDPGTIRLPSPPADLTTDKIARRLRDGELGQPYILETDCERRLHFTPHAVQSVMRLDEPNALTTAYTRKMMAFLLFNPNPRKIVMVGLGGGSLAKFCYQHLCKTKITVAEIDSRVISLRDEFCIPADDHRFSIVCEDGAHYMSRLSGSVDVLMVDAFDASGVAPTLAMSNFYTHAAQRLPPNGLLVMNLSGTPRRYVTHIEQVLAAFPGSVMLVPVVSDRNLLLFAFKRRIPLLRTARYELRARLLQARFALEFPRYLHRICQGHMLS